MMPMPMQDDDAVQSMIVQGSLVDKPNEPKINKVLSNLSTVPNRFPDWNVAESCPKVQSTHRPSVLQVLCSAALQTPGCGH